jgi:hypothetical protein
MNSTIITEAKFAEELNSSHDNSDRQKKSMQHIK